MSTYGPPPWPRGRRAVLYVTPPADLPRGPVLVCRHGSTLERGCRHCLGPESWRVRHHETRPRLTPGRLAVLAVLIVATLLYLAAMVHNVAPAWPARVQRDLIACRRVATDCKVRHGSGGWIVTGLDGDFTR